MPNCIFSFLAILSLPWHGGGGGGGGGGGLGGRGKGSGKRAMGAAYSYFTATKNIGEKNAE